MRSRTKIVILAVLLCMGAGILSYRILQVRRESAAVMCVMPARVKPILSGPVHPWPPQKGMPYPDLQMIDQTGRLMRLSELKGKVILISPEAMTCVACQAWDGAHIVGALPPGSPQDGIYAMSQYMPGFSGGIRYDDPRIVVVHLLLFDRQIKATHASDAKLWADHFLLDRSANRIALAGSEQLLQPGYYPTTYNLVCGWQLIDKNFIVRADAGCHYPSDDLYKTLLPMIPKLLAE